MDLLSLFCIGIMALAVFTAIFLIIRSIIKSRTAAPPIGAHQDWCRKCRQLTTHHGTVCDVCYAKSAAVPGLAANQPGQFAEPGQQVQSGEPAPPSQLDAAMPPGAAPNGLPLHSVRDDLLATARQLARWQAARLINDADYNSLITLVRHELRQHSQVAPAITHTSPTLTPPATQPTPPPAAASPSVPPTPAPGELYVDAIIVEADSPADGSQPQPGLALPDAGGSVPEYGRPLPSYDSSLFQTSTTPPDLGTASPLSPMPPLGAAPPLGGSATPPVVRPAPTRPIHPLDRPPEPPQPKLPSAPRRALADVLQSFMEESNIRWGELVSGVLIVVSAVGLVISLRTTLRQTIPYFPALLFMLVTGGIHFAGQYTLKKWNLKSTSRGLLVIGLLLVPLNFLAAILLAGDTEHLRPVTDPVFLLAVAIGISGYGYMIWRAAGALIGEQAWRLVASVLGPAAATIVVSRLAPSGPTPLSSAALLAFPLLCFTVPLLHHARQARGLTDRNRRWRLFSSGLLLELALAVFSLLAPVGLLLARAGDHREALACAAPPLSALGGVVLLIGGLLHRRLSVATISLPTIRTIGTALGIFGIIGLLGLAAAAWPHPDLLIAVGLLDFALLVTLAIAGDEALLHLPAGAALTLATLVGQVRLFGQLGTAGSSGGVGAEAGTGAEAAAATLVAAAGIGRQLIDQLLTGATGLTSTLLAGAFAAVAIGWSRLANRRLELRCYELLAGFVGTLAIGLTLWAGFLRDAAHGSQIATALLIAQAAAAFIPGFVLRRSLPVYVGSALLCLAWEHAFLRNELIRSRLPEMVEPGLLAALAAALSLASFAVIAHILSKVLLLERDAASPAAEPLKFPVPNWLAALMSGRTWKTAVVLPLARSALAIAAIVTPAVLWIGDQRFATSWFETATVATVLLVGALLERKRTLWSVFQALSAWLVVLTMFVIGQRSSSWSDTIWDVRILVPAIAALGVWCVAWTGLRLTVAKLPRLGEFTLPAEQWPRVDTGIRVSLVAAVLFAAIYAVHPGVGLELGWLTPPLNRPLDTSTLAPSLVPGIASWFAVAAVIGATCAAFLEHDRRSQWDELVVTTLAIPLLLASAWTEQSAGASATRWTVAAWVAVWSGPALLRNWLLTRSSIWPTAAIRSVRNGSLAFGTMAIVGLTSAVLIRLLDEGKLGGPAADSWFASLGSSLSFGVPLAILVGTYLAHAARDSDARLALIGSFNFQFLVTLGCLIPSLKTGTPTGVALVAKLLQWNFGGLACYSLVWLALKRFIEPVEALSRELKTQLAAFFSMAIAFTIFGAAMLTCEQELELPIHDITQQLGNWPSYAILGIAAAVLIWLKRRAPAIALTEILLWIAVAAAPLAGATLDMFDSRDGIDDRWGLHALEVGWTLAACALAWRSGRDRTRQSLVATVMSVALSLVGLWHIASEDPQTPWWCTSALCGAAIALSLLGLRRRSQIYAHASLPLWPIAAVHFFLEIERYFPNRDAIAIVLGPLGLVALVSEIWLTIEVWYQRRGEPGIDPRIPWLRVHATAVTLMLPMVFIVFVLGPFLQSLSSRAGGTPILPIVPSSSLAVVLLARIISGLWDRRDKLALAYLYFTALATVSMIAEFFVLPGKDHLLALAGGGAAVVLLSSWIWHAGARWASWAKQLQIPEPIEILKRTSLWLPWVNLVLSAVTAFVCLTEVLAHEARTARVIAGLIPLLLATSLGLLSQQERRGSFRVLALAFAAFAALLLGWADIEPSSSGHLFGAEKLLARVIRALIVCSTMTFVYGVVVRRVLRLGADWLNALLFMGRVLGGLAFGSLLLTLMMEGLLFESGVGVRSLTDPQAGVVALTLVALTGGLLALALWRSSTDGAQAESPLAIGSFAQQLTGARTRDELRRMLCVYGAQLVLVLLFGHLYLAKPIWFQGTLRQWWPYIVIAIAFAGVGVGELCQRLGLRVLAEPLQRTGGFLPLLPVIGWWIVGSRTDYAGVLFVIGIVYVILAFLRRSVVSRIAAGLAGNGALWAMLQKWEGFSLLEHPQLWLIPPAVSILVAAHLNRQRLTSIQLAAIRYAAVIVIYLSSTSELFIVGVGRSLWPPLILAALSLAGMLLGVVLRVRAFLYLGASFVLLSLVSMVWHAAKNIQHVWPWWAFGICSGLAILTLLGIFEKKRPEVLALIRKLREWDQ